MPKNKNAEYRFMVLDRCFSDFRHKYNIEELLEKVNDKLYDANGSKSMIMETAYILKPHRMMAKNVIIVILSRISPSTKMNYQ